MTYLPLQVWQIHWAVNASPAWLGPAKDKAAKMVADK
jgi:hypothetical protein